MFVLAHSILVPHYHHDRNHRAAAQALRPMSREPLSILCPLRPHNSTCGYCSPPGERSKTQSSYHAAECMPLQLSCRVHLAKHHL